MSKRYTHALACATSKQSSREKIACDILSAGSHEKIIPYLGGASDKTPFEDLLRGQMKRNTVLRFEKMRHAEMPISYAEATGGIIQRDRIPSLEYGHYIRGDFFKYIGDILDQDLPKLPTHFWLDFCGMPTTKLIQKIYEEVFERISENIGWSCYLTFNVGPRLCKELKQIFKGEKLTTAQKAKRVCKWLSEDNCDNIRGEVFDLYRNGISEMIVLKFTNTDTAKAKKTVSDYLSLANRGFSNKQIAAMWQIGIMQVAGFAAQAKRKGMI